MALEVARPSVAPCNREMLVDWRSLDRFPAATADWQWRRMPWSRTSDASEAAVQRVARRWAPTDLQLIATPDSKRLLPTILQPRYAYAAYSRLCRQYVRGLVFVTCCGFAVLAAAALELISIDKTIRMVAFVVISSALICVERFSVLATLREAQDRTLYFHWMVTNAGPPLAIGTGFMCACALAQFALQSQYGSLAEFLWHYGLVYEHVAVGDWWRLLVGPLWHSGLVHWATNLALAICALPLACALGQRHAYLWFGGAVLTSSLGSFAASAYHGIDATLGVSGGLYGLLGGACAAAWNQRANLPRSLFPWLLAVTLAWIAFPALLSPKSNDIGHLAGTLGGALIAWASTRQRSQADARNTIV